jgi:two-component system cell cycle sensor histidine kinase/response regulator CckA
VAIVAADAECHGRVDMPLADSTLFGAITEHLPVGIAVARAASGEVLYANATLAALVAPFDVADLARGDGAMFERSGFPGEPYPPAELPFARAIRERTEIKVSDLVLCRDGAKENLRVIGRPIDGADGLVSHVVLVFQSISGEIAHETAIRRAEADRAEMLASAVDAQRRAETIHRRLLEVVDHAPVIFFAVDRDGIFTLAEGRALATLGRKPKEALGQSVFQRYRDNPRALANIRRALAGESFTDVVDVGPLVFETWYAPLPGPEGGMLGVATDVTERHRMQARILSAERMASVGTIAASVAHEINNPLSYVIACVDFLVREGNPIQRWVRVLGARYPDDPDVSQLELRLRRLVEPFDNVRDGIERMRVIARDLKTFARVDDQDRVPVDVREVLKSAIRMASNETEHRATVVTDLAEVPWVSASEPRLGQVFLNLLVNAAQAFAPDSPWENNRIRIRTAQGEGDRVVIEIADTGPGIEPRILARIFEPFFTTKPVGVGTGLGLSVCRNIVESYGGTIEVLSQVGKGTTFRVTLSPMVGTSSRPPPSQRKLGTTVSPKLMNLLVIDDDPMVGSAFRLTLSREAQVRVVTSGQAALELIGTDDGFDLIFCDLMMPGLTGRDFFAELSRTNPLLAQKIVFMTGGAIDQDVREFVARVPNRCLQKPFDPLSVVHEALLLS